MSPVNVAQWTDLSVEVRINVLSRLEANLDPSVVWHERRCLEFFAKEHSKMQTLKLVCSKFNKAFDDSQFSRCLCLREAFSTRNIPNLLRWVERQHSSLQLIACNVGAPTLAAALAAVACSAAQLHFAYVPKVSQAVDILPCYSALHSIDLRSGGYNRPLLGLQPLAALPSLGKLFLAQGTFHGVEPLFHLTHLELSDASVTCQAACIWGIKLLKLRVHNSELCLQGRGLVACQNLRRLMLMNCVIGASQHNDTLALMAHLPAQIPAGMAALAQLTSLMITIHGRAIEDIDFSWLGSLTGLHDLDFDARENMVLPAELTDLTSLRNLWLTTADSEVKTACMDFQVNWLRMRSLENISILSGLYAFDSQLLQIVNCTGIKELHFRGVRSANADSAMYFAILMHSLGIKRPDVACYWNHLEMSVDSPMFLNYANAGL